MIVKFGPVAIGIVLIILVKMLMAPFDIIGLVAVGFVVGYMVAAGLFSGMVNSVIVGVFEGIIGVFISLFTNSYNSFLSSVFYELTSFTSVMDLNSLIFYLIHLCLIMGISGAIGGFLSRR